MSTFEIKNSKIKGLLIFLAYIAILIFGSSASFFILAEFGIFEVINDIARIPESKSEADSKLVLLFGSWFIVACVIWVFMIWVMEKVFK